MEDEFYSYQLEVVKSNWGEAGKAINLRWKDGVFVEEYVFVKPVEHHVDAMAEQEFMDLLRKETLKQNWVSPRPTARNFAPRVFSAASDSKYRGEKGRRAHRGHGFACTPKALSRTFSTKPLVMSLFASKSIT